MAIVYSTRVFAIDVEHVPLPRGGSHEIATIRHAPCVVLIPVLDDGRIVLIRQYRHSVKRVLWELPAGSIDPGEAPEAAAMRECEEETSWRRAASSVWPHVSAPGTDEEMMFSERWPASACGGFPHRPMRTRTPFIPRRSPRPGDASPWRRRRSRRPRVDLI